MISQKLLKDEIVGEFVTVAGSDQEEPSSPVNEHTPELIPHSEDKIYHVFYGIEIKNVMEWKEYLDLTMQNNLLCEYSTYMWCVCVCVRVCVCVLCLW